MSTWSDQAYLIDSPLIQFPTSHMFSPASFLSSRIGADMEYGSIFVASDTKVYHLNLAKTVSELHDTRTTNDGNVVHKKRYEQSDSNSRCSPYGTTNNIIPKNWAAMVPLHRIHHISHRYEIQSLQVRRLSDKELQIATVDGWGRAVISTTSYSSEECWTGSPHNNYATVPVSMEDGEEGWAGLDWDPWHVCRVAIARQFFRDVTIYDKDLAIRRFMLSHTPHAIRFLSQATNEDAVTFTSHSNDNFCSLVACLEGSYLTVWDTRVGEGGGRIHHKCYGNGSLYGMNISHRGSIAVGGVDRMVSILDPRTWNVRCRWNNCCKYECKHVFFPGKEECRCIVVGVDNELSCGYVGESCSVQLSEKRPRMLSGASLVSCKRLFGFRADSRWIGVTKELFHGYTHILGMSENGGLYWLRMDES